MDSGCDVHFAKNLCWISKDDRKELDMIRSGGVFFVAARPSKSSSREANTLELIPMTAADVEQAALASEHDHMNHMNHVFHVFHVNHFDSLDSGISRDSRRFT